MASTPSAVPSSSSPPSAAFLHHTPSSSAMAPPPASELDTTMEDAEEEDEPTAATVQDDEFTFNAPTFYDLKHPERERQYVNNADGYFYTPPATPQRPPPPPQHTPFTPQRHAPQKPPTPFTPQPPAPCTPQPQPTPQRHVTPAVEDADTEMAVEDDDGDDRMSDGGRSDDTLVLEALATAVPTAPHSAPPPSRSHPGLSSSLLQPTKSFLMRVQAEQAERTAVDQHHHAPTASSKLTHARSPQLRTTQKAMQRHQSEPKLSSTSRELQRIQEEKARLQLEAQKVREYHERVRLQRVPANVHQRSTKQLTIPQSPYLEVGHRSRRTFNQSLTSSDEGEGDAPLREEPHPYIPPEQLLSRDFEFPVTHAPRSHNGNGTHSVTVPHTPQLHTLERAARRNVFPSEESPERPHVDYSKMKVNGVTRPLSPQFETDRRAAQAAAYRKPIEVVDKDAEELNRKFHARPVPRSVLEAPQRASPQKAPKPTLTKPVSPKLATSSRARFNAANSVEDEQVEKKALSSSNGPRRTGPTIPETPPLRSLQRHQMYQENLRRRQEAEEEEMRRQREFKAQPLRITTNPPKFEGSKRPLTEIQPFALRSDHLHERAQERLERKRREEEEKLRAAAKFRAMPMPDLTAVEDEANAAARVPVRSLTKPSSPKFATDRRAAERAAFEAAERERRAREEEEKRRADEEKRRREEEEIKRIRREQLTFHARPAPVSKAYEVKPSTRTLTEPESPYLQTKVRGGSTTTAA